MHTKEPWVCNIEPERYPESDDADYPAIIRDSAGNVVLYIPEAYSGCGNYESNARRIVDCVNAMQGIPDPASYVAAMGACVEALEPFIENVEIVDWLGAEDDSSVERPPFLAGDYRRAASAYAAASAAMPAGEGV